MEMKTTLLVAPMALGVPALYFAGITAGFCTFLAGALWISAGTRFYLHLANVSVPLSGTRIIFTPGISDLRPFPTPFYF
jgi:hypothetical protein